MVSDDGLDWTVNNNLRDDKKGLGQQYILAPRARGRREITGRIEKEWLSKTHYDKLIAGTTAAILVTCTGSGPNVMTFRWANVFFEGETPGVEEEGEDQDHVLTFRAYHDATYNAFQIVETNDTAPT